MKYGLSDQQLKWILSCIQGFPEVERVILFGSRAMGNFKPGSDIDLWVMGEKLTPLVVNQLYGQLNEEVQVPFQFDIIHGTTDPALLEHINSQGVLFYEKPQQKHASPASKMKN